MVENIKVLLPIILILAIITSASLTAFSAIGTVGIPREESQAESEVPIEFMSWNVSEKPPLKFYEDLLHTLAKRYPKLVKVYSIGKSWRERDIWCIEVTSNVKSKDEKVGIAIVGNIHGNEWLAGLAAAYTAWWFVVNYEYNITARRILDNYVLYIIPILNPDGYVQGIRENLRPIDHNGDGIPYGDPYYDVNGDGVISLIYIGAPDSKPEERKFLGFESPDFDNNGIPGDDPKRGVDLNRNFNYMWWRYDADTGIGCKYANAGPFPASEPEVQAIQRFLITHPVWALATLHTGEQSVLWPWCYTPEPTPDHEFMSRVAMLMARAMSMVTGRGYYYKQSYYDYPTTAELIDWAYGRLHIHSYTVELYAPGTKPRWPPEAAFGKLTVWGNPIPPDNWTYVGHWEKWDNVWFRTRGYDLIRDKAPPDLELMLKGWLEAAIVMIMSEPSGEGPKVPEYMSWYDIPYCSCYNSTVQNTK